MMRVTLLQTNIAWEDKQKNLLLLRPKLEKLCGETDIVLLPETFSTGFSMNSAQLAEPIDGETITTLKRWAVEFQFAIAGSYIACDNDEHTSQGTTHPYNRAFFLTPDGEEHYYNKRHLFRMGKETEFFSAGTERPVITYKGWNILMLVCYDLRFPVWSRSRNNEYDLLIYVANWPIARRRVWDVLLQARALENLCYVCGVNRVGTDNANIPYNGGSAAYSHKGKLLASVPDGEEDYSTATLNLSALREFRDKFPAWKDADSFQIIESKPTATSDFDIGNG